MTAVAPLFVLTGDAVMSPADEQQWAYTTHEQGGPLAPAPIRAAWAAAFAAFDVPHYLIGSFVAPGPMQGQFEVSAPVGKAWGSSKGPGSNFAALLSFVLVDTTAFHLPRPPYGPDPFAAGVPGVVSPSNYPGLTAIGSLIMVPTSSCGGYANGYLNDAINGYSQISPAGPWYFDSAIANLGNEPFEAINPGNGIPPADAIWPLVAGRTYAVYAVPQAGSFPLAGTAGLIGGGGYEDWPAFGAQDHASCPDVRTDYPFAWPQYDPPQIPAGWPAAVPSQAFETGELWSAGRWLAGHDDSPTGAPLYHFRTGQRFHVEVEGAVVSAVGTVLPAVGCDPPCPAGQTCVSGVCQSTPPAPPPPTPASTFPWWALLLAGGAVAAGAAEKQRKQRERARGR